MSPFGLPRLPRLGESPINIVGNGAKTLIGDIKKLANDLNESMGTMDRELTAISREDEEAHPEDIPGSKEEFVSDDTTYRFQLDLLIDNLTDLETVHLPNQGRIGGQPCDCIAKHARILRAHAKETIPISSRQGRDSSVLKQLATEADHLMEIGTKEAVISGRFDSEYLQLSGVMSQYRKHMENLLGQSHTSYSAECKTCPSTLNLKAFIEKKKQAVIKVTTEPVQETESPSEAEAETSQA